MKKIFIYSFILVILIAFVNLNKTKAQTSIIGSAYISEDIYTPSPNRTWDGICQEPSHSNANSYGNLEVSGVPYSFDLYVSTWDPSPGVSGDVGFFVRQYPTGVNINSGSSFFLEAGKNANSGDIEYDIRSLEAGILKNGDDIYIALTYVLGWQDLTQFYYDYYIELYKWDPVVGTLNQFAGPYNLSNAGYPDQLNRGWIHQDVNGLNKIVITWEQNGTIYSRAGQIIPGGVELGGTGELTNLPSSMTQPDVAMLKTTNGLINLYFSFTDDALNTLFVYKGDFDQLLNVNTLNNFPLIFPPSGPTSPLPPLLSNPYSGDIVNTFSYSGSFGLPRIDAPDSAQTNDMNDVWSVVVADHHSDNDYIRAITYDGQTGIISEEILNDGNLIPGGDISFTNNEEEYNRRPVVAFSNNGSHLFYAWVYRSPEINNSLGIGDSAMYLSLKTNFDLTLINSYAPPRYFKVAQAPSGNPPTSYVGCSPSIALSTQNDASPYLYTSFVLWDYPWSTSYQIGLKTNNWNTTIGFKPSGETKINEEETKTDGFQIFPNPFKSSFSLKTQIDETKTCDLTIYNLLGQKVYSDKGTISKLNKELKDIGNKLESGSYFIKLQPEKGKAFNQKLLKL